MDKSSWDEFESTLNKVAWYGEVFIKAEGGTNWNKVGGISIYTTPWIDLYWHIENGEFNTSCEKLNGLDLKRGESDIVIERLKKLIKAFDELELTHGIVNIKASIETYSTGNLIKGLNGLLSRDITLHDFWTNGEADKMVLLRVNNYRYMSILKASYANVIHSLQSQEADQIKMLKAQVQKYKDLVKEYDNKVQLLEYEHKRNSDDLAQIKSEKRALYVQNIELSKQIVENKKSLEDLIQIRSEKKDLYDQNIELSKQICELKSVKYRSEEDDLPNTATFKMVLLYRLGFLEAHIWPPATFTQIGKVIAKFIGAKDAYTIGKYRERLIGNYGQQMLEENDEKVKKFLQTDFEKINLEKQKFLMLLEKKKK